MKQDLDKNQPLPPKTSPAPGSEDESAHLDDAVIGRAFRWSFLAFVVIVGIAGTAIWYANRKPAAKPARITSITAPVAPQSAQAEIPMAKFTDITASSGITFIH